MSDLVRQRLDDIQDLEARYGARCNAAEVNAYQKGLVTFEQLASVLAVRKVTPRSEIRERQNDINGRPMQD